MIDCGRLCHGGAHNTSLFIFCPSGVDLVTAGLMRYRQMSSNGKLQRTIYWQPPVIGQRDIVYITLSASHPGQEKRSSLKLKCWSGKEYEYLPGGYNAPEQSTRNKLVHNRRRTKTIKVWRIRTREDDVHLHPRREIQSSH